MMGEIAPFLDVTLFHSFLFYVLFHSSSISVYSTVDGHLGCLLLFMYVSWNVLEYGFLLSI